MKRVYKSEDGLIFETEEECLKYEASKAQEIKIIETLNTVAECALSDISVDRDGDIRSDLEVFKEDICIPLAKTMARLGKTL